MFAQLFNRHYLQRSLQSKQMPLRLSVFVLISSFVIMSLLFTAREYALLQDMELWAYDQMTLLRADLPPDPRLLLVEISEADIQQMDAYPFPDQAIADLINKLKSYQPAVIGLDIFRDVPQGQGRDALLQVLQDPDVFSIRSLGLPGQKSVPAPEGVPIKQIGFNDFALDADGVVRRNLMYAAADGRMWTSFSLNLVIHYLRKKGLPDYHFMGNDFYLGKHVFTPLDPNAGGYQNEDTGGYQSMLNYRSSDYPTETVRFFDVLEGRVASRLIENKIVIIGTTAESAKDMGFTPYTRHRDEQQLNGTLFTSGVVVHTHEVSDLLTQALQDTGTTEPPYILSFWSNTQEHIWIIFWGFLGLALLWYSHRPLTLLLVIFSSIVGLWGLSFMLFLYALWVPVIPAFLAFVWVSIGVLSTRFVYHSFYDHLTGLPNATAFQRRLRLRYLRYAKQNPEAISLTVAQRQNQTICVAILLLDLDRFKTINAVLGREIGDALLIAFAKRLSAILEQLDNIQGYLARVGGSEFSIMLKAPQNTHVAGEVANIIHTEMRNPFVLQNEEVFTHANIGIALGFKGEQRDLLRDARSAMNRAKLLDKSEAEVFESDMEALAIARFNLERDLRHAINRQQEDEYGAVHIPEFKIHYQPLVNMNSGCISGFEALVRWHHPERGIVSPMEFIPVAEETGLIVAIGESVLRQACRQMRTWQARYPTLNLNMLSVNLSRKQFAQENIVDIVAAALKNSELNPEVLKLEITESAVMANVTATQKTLKHLKALNVKISIDDFGTGYSSLEYLTQFPTDTLKVDQSFVRCMDTGEENKVVVETIIALAHNLRMDVVAEGIENHAQLQQLRALGCEYGQGYLFAKPLDKQHAERLLRKNPSW